MVSVETIDEKELGDRSHIAHDECYAAVVEPRPDIDRIESLLAKLGLERLLVLGTQLHDDHVARGLVLAERTGARDVAAAGVVAFDRRSVADAEGLAAGRLRIRIVATPDHPDGGVADLVSDGDALAGMFTGGSFRCGGVLGTGPSQ